MFIFLDESFGQNHTVVGCLCVPKDNILALEKDFLTNRVKKNCWGELSWSGISSSYIEKYKKFLLGYLSNNNVTFHSWAYGNPDGNFRGNKNKLLHQHEYSLLKNTIRKCLNNGYKQFYILLDQGQSDSEYALTRDYLEKTLSFKPKPEILFSSAVDSKIIGAMQISSICVCAVRYLYGTISSDVNKKLCDEIVSLLTKLNLDTSLIFSPKYPRWDLSKKFSHCLFDPLLKKPEFKEDITQPF